MEEYCIWDFNGTLLDDVEAGIRSVNTLLRERGLPVIPSTEAYRDLFGFPIREYYQRLGFDFSREPYEVVAPLWVALYLENVKESRLYWDVRDTLEALRRRGIRQVVLSATQREMLLDQLRELEIDDYFEEVLGLDNIHAASKLSLAEDWRARHPGAAAILIGDTDHDVETACTLGARCLLVARGHQSAPRLQETGAEVFNSLGALLAAVFPQSPRVSLR